MVNKQDTRLDATFGALSDPIRRSILERLTHAESSVTALAQPFNVSLPAISKHLRVLEKAGLLTQEKDGRVRRCRLDAAPMQQAADWISKYQPFWEAQLDSLADYLNQLQRDRSQEEEDLK
jgi:DNA-binding transcriptional ArsR family regulator